MKEEPKMEKVAVIIPIYKTNLSDIEMFALKQTFDVLGKHPIIIVCPNGLDLRDIDLIKRRSGLRFERFDDSFFTGLDGYNRLMLSAHFYERFLDFEYILICQTDVFVFRDELLLWCDKGYDYIGAPWIGSRETFLSNAFRTIEESIKRMQGKPKSTDIRLYKVGNGGCSLRKVKSHHDVLVDNVVYIQNLYQNSPNSIFLIEDMFFSFTAPKLNPNFSIPDYKEAVAFAIDRKPMHALQINGGNLPFACHRFSFGKNGRFWKPVIKKIIKN